MANDEISVLVVERDKQRCKAMAKMLQSAQRISSVDFVDNGLEAVAKATTRAPDVVLMNIALETHLTSIYVCREICKSASDAQVVLYGDDCEKEVVLRAYQMGAANFLMGKYSKRELLQAVLDAAEGRAAIHASSADMVRKEFKYLMDLQENQTYIVNLLVKLTPTEIAILRRFNNGMSAKEVAKLMFISNATLKTHVTHILKKFNLDSMKQVVSILSSTELFNLIDINSGKV